MNAAYNSRASRPALPLFIFVLAFLTALPRVSGQSDVLTVQQAEAFAAQWEAAVAKSDLEEVNRLVDWDAILLNAIEPFDMNEEFKKGYMKGGANLAQQITSQLAGAVQQGGSYRAVRVISREGQWHAIFRLMLPNDGGFNYHDLKLLNQNGKVRADRIDVALTGERISETMRNAMLPMIQNMKQSSGRLDESGKRELESLQKMGQLGIAARTGQHEQALKIYKSLGAKQQQTKVCMLYRIMATSVETDPVGYLAALDEYSKLFPGDASVGLITMDAAFIRRDAQLLKRAYGEISKWTGGDDLLSLMIGGALASMGKPDDAVEMTKGIDPASLKLADAHNYMLTIALSQKNYAEALKQLRVLRDQYQMDLSGIKDAEIFADFVKSPEYQEFIKN